MISIGILERHDVIRADDYVRCTSIQLFGQSDTVMTRATYGGAPLNYFRWLTVEQSMMFHFIGKTVGYVNKTMSKMTGNEEPHYEFARGQIPDAHKMTLRKEGW